MTITEVKHWFKWKEKCALALCPPDTQSPLLAFVHQRYRHYATRYSPAFQATEIETASINAREAWHGFETYFQLHRTRRGKSYKEWLFARSSAGSPAPESKDIESGVSLLLRDVVRDRLRSEYSSHRILSLDANVHPHSDHPPISLMELLPDDLNTRNEVERREMNEMAASLVNPIIDSLSYRERLALLGRELGLSLATPMLLKAAACRKTALADAHRTALNAIAHHTTSAYPNETHATQASLTVAVFTLLRQRILFWAEAEKGLSDFLNTKEAP